MLFRSHLPKANRCGRQSEHPLPFGLSTDSATGPGCSRKPCTIIISTQLPLKRKTKYDNLPRCDHGQTVLIPECVCLLRAPASLRHATSVAHESVRRGIEPDLNSVSPGRVQTLL
jgi:hypothetical protein